MKPKPKAIVLDIIETCFPLDPLGAKGAAWISSVIS